jgi:hypothetical protein
VIELYDLRAARDTSAAAPTPAQPQSQTLAAVDGGAPAPIQVVWAAYIYGVIGGVGATVQTPPIAGVQQAFAQSPYLQRNAEAP